MAEGHLAALFGVGCKPGNQVIADFDETVGDRIFALRDVNQLAGQVNVFSIQAPELGLAPRPAKRPIAIARHKSAPVARKRASASGKVKIPALVICSLAFSIPRAGFFKRL